MSRQNLPPIDEALRKLRANDLVAGRFRLVDVLGHGGMGVVWRAQDETLELPVALKFLPEVLIRDATALDALKNETRQALRLTHPNILRIHNLVEDREREVACIAMELASGGNLDHLRIEQANSWFEPRQIHGWLEELCAALIHAHEVAGVVHRDLKPSNLLLDETGRLKIADFGFSARVSASVTQSSRLKSAGTPAYSSPQQIKGERATPSDDLYALGATIYCLLTGRPPFFRGDILHQLLETTAPKVNTLRQETGSHVQVVSQGWETLVAQLLAKDPAKRPPDVRAVAARLAELRREPVSSRTPANAAGAGSVRARLAEAEEIVEVPPLFLRWKFWATVWGAALLLASTAFWAGRDRPNKDEDDYVPISADIAESNPFVRPERPAAAEKTVPAWAQPKKETSATASAEETPGPEVAEQPAAKTPAMEKSEAPVPTAPVPEPSDQERFQTLIAEGKELRGNGDAVDALVKLREATALQPENPEGMAELALTFERLKLVDRAAEQWQRILDIGESAGSYYLAAENRIKMPLTQAIAAAEMSRLSPGHAVLTPAPSAPSAPPPAEITSPSANPVKPPAPRDESVSSLKPEALLGIGLVEREDDLDQVGKRLTLRIQLKAQAGAHVNVSDVDISVLLYDEQSGGTVVRTDADVSYRFADPPVNWAGGTDETIEVSYDRTNTPPAKGKRKFFGYIVRIYHHGELQDVRAEPGLLALTFPAPDRITADPSATPSSRSRSRR